MDARFLTIRSATWFVFAASIVCVSAVQAQPPVQVRTENFIVTSRTQEFAQKVAETAENLRRELSIYWLGKETPRWPQPCPIQVMAGPRIGAGGRTTFTLIQGTVRNWEMEVQGTPERVLDSVLPHEITHTILATHFASLGKPVPRWADEGACTTVEHRAERSKHEHMLVQFLQQGRGIPFAAMFTMRDYPQDIMPLYAQGYSVAAFLIAQGGETEGPLRFIRFLEEGMRTEDWVAATEQFYGYPRVGKLQSAWNQWVGDGGGQTERYTAVALGHSTQGLASLDGGPARNNGSIRMASNTVPATSGASDLNAPWRAALVSPGQPQNLAASPATPLSTNANTIAFGTPEPTQTPSEVAAAGFNSPFPANGSAEAPASPAPSSRTISGDYINWSPQPTNSLRR